eukprot:CAMPEP_0179843130 /NCGR_PEP_ID=MMETSP0982-20121206/3526_1 /TAXON_ID=483367 /ORGANISM="non described non described, Strain CCMP 2436" /LENGTH=107 /DNA_ID=CAMNT_0021727509 /DNA_START=535 /DNA_END=858 /DNA_ORIENTATION=-
MIYMLCPSAPPSPSSSPSPSRSSSRRKESTSSSESSASTPAPTASAAASEGAWPLRLIISLCVGGGVFFLVCVPAGLFLVFLVVRRSSTRPSGPTTMIYATPDPPAA